MPWSSIQSMKLLYLTHRHPASHVTYPMKLIAAPHTTHTGLTDIHINTILSELFLPADLVLYIRIAFVDSCTGNCAVSVHKVRAVWISLFFGFSASFFICFPSYTIRLDSAV